ncbi:MAG: GNAT family N-acetyltransferase [Muribaculaceae bacterium]|nr:GNAT family N-acetyltransferase [Muribaculaceae bacterium]
MDVRITEANASHAPYIGKAITMAIGDELVNGLAGEKHTPDDVLELFAHLAGRTDSQYSYLNSLVAVDENEKPLGVVIAYDGADLHRLRVPFFEEAEKKISLKIEGEPADETGPEEIYMDSLAVFPPYRGMGIGRKLIEAAYEKAVKSGKPLGLLVSKENSNARALYESLGFKAVGERPFAGETMDHLMKTT